MERDFLGLGGSRTAPATTKEETTVASEDLMSMRGSAMQWSFSNKVSATPQILSFKSCPEEKPRKTIHDPLSASALNPISITNAFDSTQKPFSSTVQKNMTLDRQGINHYAMTTYSVQHCNAYPIHGLQQMRIIPASNQQNQAITVSMSSPVLHSHIVSTGSSGVANAMNPQQSLGGVPILSPASIHLTPSSTVGTADLRNGSKSSGAPAQLTIFYAGSVCVYDDISPEKAQAIMLLAGHGSSATHNKMLSSAQVQAPITRHSAGDDNVGNKTYITSPCLGLPNPISATSSSINEFAKVKSVIALASASSQTESPEAVTSVPSVSATLIPAVAVPQARKASLARFLEKRKERTINTSPYTTSKKSHDCNATGSETVSLSINSFSSPSHSLAAKEGSD